MSSAKGDRGRHRGQKHQNTFAYKHNKGSKKTAQILSIQHHGLCDRCDEKIEWRKKFRKYKPIKMPRKCQRCNKEHVVSRAYHLICDDCAKEKHVCPMCIDPLPEGKKSSDETAMLPRATEPEIERYLATLRERQRRSILRKLDEGTIAIYRQSEGVFLIKNLNDDDDEDGSDEDDDEEDGESDASGSKAETDADSDDHVLKLEAAAKDVEAAPLLSPVPAPVPADEEAHNLLPDQTIIKAETSADVKPILKTGGEAAVADNSEDAKPLEDGKQVTFASTPVQQESASAALDEAQTTD
ncbi:Hypothetical Protein FCC1311_028462 [Hondaea fermentalgiana]|uniref:Uncharacterized protein n=1 Tax=Hondaea fermentalgiana TaxID=2315210 RepID=A0A2R5G7V6_9STRA|nr:Hypothetical Protein FCC1311_028462 [Hondaea fermentalgiana]|eukprot:GBG26625.1 Hypothetical Protein FCC1311_028462 [Hondaea fermentalgiana]